MVRFLYMLVETKNKALK